MIITVKRTIAAAAIGGLVAMLRPDASAAVVATLSADAHTTSALPSTNYGAALSLEVSGPRTTIAAKNAYVQFDLTSLPGGITGVDVAKATLNVFANTFASVWARTPSPPSARRCPTWVRCSP